MKDGMGYVQARRIAANEGPPLLFIMKNIFDALQQSNDWMIFGCV
jgi:hypothetical protein